MDIIPERQPVEGGSGGAPAIARRPDWSALADECRGRLDAGRRAAAAEQLGVPAAALDRFPLLGFLPNDAGGGCLVVPETDAAGRMTGQARLMPWGDEFAARQSVRGLVLPDGWRDRPGPTFVVEGVAAVVAMTAAGLPAVGWPGTAKYVRLLANLFVDWPKDRGIVVIGVGAEAVAEKLETRLGRRVGYCVASGCADVRAWLTAPDRGDAPWHERGRRLAALLTAGLPPPSQPRRPRPTGSRAPCGSRTWRTPRRSWRSSVPTSATQRT